MSHHIYRTRALVLSLRPHKEDDVLVTLLTEEFGVVRAIAVSARKESSRHRYALQPLTELFVSLVRGKVFWRITGTHIERAWSNDIAMQGDRASARKILRIIEAYVPEEESNSRLFSLIEQMLDALVEPKNRSVRNMIEPLAVLAVLSELGYVDKDFTEHYIPLFSFSAENIKRAQIDRASIISRINSALSSSHL